MWEVTNLGPYHDGTRYIVRNHNTGGYLADNSLSGGAIHFLDPTEAQSVCDILNAGNTR
jgi:hypothetical protein